MRIKEIITKYEMSWCLNKFSQLLQYMEAIEENMQIDIGT